MYINDFKKKIERLHEYNPECLQGRLAKSISGDMSLSVPELTSNYFDLAFCEDVLYYMKLDQPDFEKVQSAINEMARLVHPGGWVVAYETKMDVKVEKTDDFWCPYIPLNDPADILRGAVYR
jgi:hypothetical protein